MFVLDTDVVSELRKVEAGKGHRQVAAWSEQVIPGETFLAAITIHELELGILLLERKDKRQGAILRAWMDTRVMPAFGSDIAGRCDRGAALRQVARTGPETHAGCFDRSDCPGSSHDCRDTQCAGFRADGC